MRAALCPFLLILLLLALSPLTLRAASPALPPRPADYVTDNAGVLDPADRKSLDDRLQQFERDTSNQFLVAIYTDLPPNEELADYCTRTFQSWKVGLKKPDNGVVLFIFTNSHKLQIITGYGLEGALPDATCKDIIDTRITPRFKAGDFSGGIHAGVDAIIAATRGEYRGTGHTVADKVPDLGTLFFWLIVAIVVVLPLLQAVARRFFGTVYASRRPSGLLTNLLYAWAMRPNPYRSASRGGWISSGGGFGGGGFGGGGGGGFSSGGGSTGGGGAGGSW